MEGRRFNEVCLVFFYFILKIVDVQVNLRTLQLILRGSKVISRINSPVPLKELEHVTFGYPYGTSVSSI